MPLIRIQIRRDTAANWTAANSVLAAGEPAVETDTGRRKTGDGIRNWNSLPYDTESGLASTTPAAIGTAAVGTSKTAARADHVHALPSTIAATAITTTGNVTVGGDLTVTGALTSGSTSVAAANVTGLAEAVDDRVAQLLVAGHGIALAYDDSAGTLTASVASSGANAHSHSISQVTGLQAALDSKAAATHEHSIANVTTLADELSRRPVSVATGIAGANVITNIVYISQVAYDALSTKNATTLYVIV